ncbi:PREDICTED: LOC109707713 isoform [Prunus dulcis]|uniref:PREDICTED: LOC109707713 isoform n=2 Tax=Prunus dulcis TaxID=3755 RepID=A0A5E4FRR5_PRUDU|nr:PREDICTED: LOC109707713 isoform [Prunus dulcis]
MEHQPLLQRYRRDRRKLLEFLLSSSGLVTELRTPTGSAASLSHIDFDTLSADYVLDCVKSGGVLDISEATKKYFHESSYPLMIHSQLGNSFFLLSDPELSGSPPRRVPSPINVNRTSENASSSSTQMDSLNVEDIAKAGDCYGFKDRAMPSAPPKPVKDVTNMSLGLPHLNTGLSDDDLRESAYEILLASMATSGIVICSIEDRKKQRSSKLLSRLKSRKDTANVQSQPLERHLQLLNTIRVQMQISEAMDESTRQKLMLLASGRTRVQIDVPQVLMGLLNGTFKSDFPNEKSYLQWKNRQASILEELLCFSANLVAHDQQAIKRSLAVVRNSKEWDFMSLSERAEVLSVIKEAALKFSSLPGHFGIQSETYYWTSGYHLNIRLYEKLLLGVFDVLDEGQLIEEADDFLMLIKMAWPTLGITQKIHDALYGWVLFQQFVATDEPVLLEYATLELQKIISAEDDDEKLRLYMNSLLCSRQCNGSEIKLSLVEAVFYLISIWSESKLEDYHLHFSQQPCHLKKVWSLVSVVGIHTFRDGGDMKLSRLNILDEDPSTIFESYVKRSIEAAYRRVASNIDQLSKVEKKHPLNVLANELRLISEREFNVFYPKLCKLCPQSVMIVAMQLHRVYWERLKSFIDGVSSLSEDVISVLPAAHLLDQGLTQLYNIGNGANSGDLHHYPIGEVAKPIILDWVIAQHARILEWTGRAFDLEEWEPLSSQQRQAPSIIEVFRIIEETLDQFFGFNLPMDITHLQGLLSVVFHALDAYLLKLLDELVEKNHLYPSPPPLTRYKETTIPVMKKKLLECVPLDDNVYDKLNSLTIPKLCIRLNTLKYIQKQIDILEEGIRKSWALVRHSSDKKWDKKQSLGTSTCNEQVDELFATTFEIIRDTAANAISRLCDFTGARVVFLDLRRAFLFGLYCGNVEGARLDGVLTHIDTVLGHLCGLIDDSLRDVVVLSIFRASLEGFVWVLLDGGPSRAFCDSDILLMEDDLATLKEFFVADGEGLPRSLVEQEAKFAEQILNVYSFQTESIIQMLMAASEQISSGLDSHDHNHVRLNNAHTLVRILCHKKDREASKFLKRQYQFPMSSEYEDTPSKDPTSRSPLRSDLTNRSMSFHWNKMSPTSFKTFKKKLQDATSEIRNVAW